ncbi:MAG: DUF418 domain-containing protein [Verrucomicrobiota bacterium]
MSTPIPGTQRIESLDLIRGFAVCGLVAINGIEFGLGTVPLVYPLDFDGGDRALWTLVMGLGCGKFVTLFATLFGAGMILFTERAELSGQSAASVYLPRLGWLLLFGNLHAYLLWHGDILVTYAVTGFVLFWCRNWSAKVFAIVGSVLFALFVLPLYAGALIAQFIDFEEVFDNESLREEAANIMELIRDEEATETAALTGTWIEQMKVRSLYVVVTHFFGIPLYLFWFAAMNMSFGMALMKSGFFRGEWSGERIRKWTGLFLVVGLPLTLGGYGIFSFADPSPAPFLWAYAALLTGLPLVAFGYAGSLMMWSQRGEPGFLRRGFTAVGRMAFTNYICQSVILSLIYYGHGLGLRGRLDFSEAMLIVPVVWVVQMVLSVWWLKRFRFGPLEWLWRWLTYGHSSLKKRTAPPQLPSENG